MEFHLPPQRPPSSSNDEDQLAAILGAERQLVVETQENYRLLKERFLATEEELALATKELEILREEKEVEKRSREELKLLEDRSRTLLRQMEEDQKHRELSKHQFQTSTLAELREVFKKELLSQDAEIHRLEDEKEGLVEENDRLLEENRDLHTEIARMKRAQKDRERKMTDDFDKQMQELVLAESKNDSSAKESIAVTSLKERIERMEETQRKRENEMRRKTEEMEERGKRLMAELEEEKHRNQQLITYQAQLEQTKTEARRMVHEKHRELDELRKKISELRTEKLKVETEASERERRIMNDFCEQSFSIDDKLNSFETVIKERDQQIENLQEKLDRFKLDESAVEQLELNSQVERESRERVEKENKRLSEVVERKDVEFTQQVSLLKMERNRLEETVGELKRRLTTSPETVEEVTRLRTLLAKKDQEEINLKEHYRSLLSRMKKSLKNIEKKHRHTQRKLEDHILL